MEASLKGMGAVRRILFDDAERAKNLATYETVCRHLIHHGADRRALRQRTLSAEIFNRYTGWSVLSRLR